MCIFCVTGKRKLILVVISCPKNQKTNYNTDPGYASATYSCYHLPVVTMS